ncbi:MAG: helix-turn-helix domain-containing protein [Vicinamibacterales bacterium]
MTYERLRLAREEKGWTIEELSRRAGIRPRTIELIDRGAFGELPPGLYGRASIRSYATAVGLDAAEMVESVRPLLLGEGDALGALARRCGHTLKAEARPSQPEPRAAARVMTAAAVTERPMARVAQILAPVARRVEPPVPELAPAPVPEPAVGFEPVAAMAIDLADEPELVTIAPVAAPELDVTLRFDASISDEAHDDSLRLNQVEAPAWDEPVVSRQADGAPAPAEDAGREWWRPAAASAIDGAVLVGIGGTLVWLTAVVGATTVPVVMRSAAPGIAVVFALIVSLYFVLFGGVGNGTPGGTLMRLGSRPSGRTVLNAREVFGRAARAVYRDSLVAD